MMRRAVGTARPKPGATVRSASLGRLGLVIGRCPGDQIADGRALNTHSHAFRDFDLHLGVTHHLRHFADETAGGDDAGATRGRPFGLYVHGRYDTNGAVRSVLSIVQALQWRQAAEVLEVVGDVADEHREAAYELGGTIAALLSPDI